MVSEYVIKVQDQDQGHVRLMVSEYVIKVQVCVDQSVGEMPNAPNPNPNPNRMCVFQSVWEIPNAGGIVPVNSLAHKYSFSNRSIREIAEGIVPESP